MFALIFSHAACRSTSGGTVACALSSCSSPVIPSSFPSALPIASASSRRNFSYDITPRMIAFCVSGLSNFKIAAVVCGGAGGAAAVESNAARTPR